MGRNNPFLADKGSIQGTILLESWRRIVTRNPDSWNTPNTHNTSRSPFLKCMSEMEDESSPYSYVRTFKEVTRPKMVSEMDKEELQVYINKILGSKGIDSPSENRTG
jgi:hypothetical protein